MKKLTTQQRMQHQMILSRYREAYKHLFLSLREFNSAALEGKEFVSSLKYWKGMPFEVSLNVPLTELVNRIEAFASLPYGDEVE